MSEMSIRQTLSSLFYKHPICSKYGAKSARPTLNNYAGPILIGHRGVSAPFPENTIPAFEHALKIGAQMLELDVRLSKDNEVVVVHDTTVDRTNRQTGFDKVCGTIGATGPVNSFTLSQLQAMGIPALKDIYLKFIEATISVEIKDESWLLCEKVVDLTRRFHRLDRTTVELIAISDPLAHRLRKFAPDLHVGHTTREIIRFVTLTKLGLTKFFKSQGALFEVPMRRGKIKIITPAFVRAAHRKGVRVFVWTINDAKVIVYLCNIGVDGIYTDDLRTARATVDAYLAAQKK